jgi:hypothetical protein
VQPACGQPADAVPIVRGVDGQHRQLLRRRHHRDKILHRRYRPRRARSGWPITGPKPLRQSARSRSGFSVIAVSPVPPAEQGTYLVGRDARAVSGSGDGGLGALEVGAQVWDAAETIVATLARCSPSVPSSADLPTTAPDTAR